MNVCLISPPTATEFSERQMAEEEVLRLIAEHAPLGVLSLAAVLEAQGVGVRLVDLNHLYYDYVRLGVRRDEGIDFPTYVLDSLADVPADVFGFSTICSTYPLTLRLARGVRRMRPAAMILLGGPQASVVDVPTLETFPEVDFILRGEAEVTLPRLLEAASTGGDLGLVGGLTYRRDGRVLRNANAPVITDLDDLPLPAYHLFPHIGDCRIFPLEAGRGCPFACTFCSTNDFFRRRYRLKSPDVLVGQMRLIKETYGVDSFDLVHDMFTVDRRKVVAFSEAVGAAGEGFRWSCSARTDCLDDELLGVMARGGCDGVFLGIDSGSERVQAALHKGLNIGEAEARVAKASRCGLRTTVSLITGFPDEREEDMRATVRFFGDSLRHEQADVQLHLLAPLAETPITSEYRERLVYDEIFSDISFQGWEQDSEDRALIVAHRDIFTNFYAIPTHWLDRHRLAELREFLLHGVSRHRWLMTFLHQDCGDLVTVFDEWKAWRARPDEPVASAYYRSREFTGELLDFVRSRYALSLTRRPHLAITMVEVERALTALSADCRKGRRRARRVALTTNAVPVVAAAAEVVTVEADYKRLVRCLRRRGDLDRIPANRSTLVLRRSGDVVQVIGTNELTSRLLGMCDGRRSVLDVAGGFATSGETGGVSVLKAGLYGLMELNRRGLVEFGMAT